MKELKNYISKIRDPRIERRKLHRLSDIVLLALISTICGYESWEMIEEFGKSRIEFLKQYLDLEHGIPSHDTIERLFKRLDSKIFSEVFLEWTKSLQSQTMGNIISIDGKTLRGSKDELHGKYAIHLVSAWSSANRLVLGHVKTACKANEIEAVKDLLKLLDIEGSVITADAMSCQKEIAQQIIDANADYILSVKDNQKTLKESIAYEFKVQSEVLSDQTIEKDHGRIETRLCEVITDLKELENKGDWKDLKSIIRITSMRTINNTTTTEYRFYIASKVGNAAYFNKAIRTHWGIENSMHWVLDVQFNEDKIRKRKDNSAENFAIVRRMALNKISNVEYKRKGIENRRRLACINSEYLRQVLKN